MKKDAHAVACAQLSAVLLRGSNSSTDTGRRIMEEKMSISKETESEILRLFYVEKWKRGTIARQLNIHHGVVDRVLLQNGISIDRLQVRTAMIDSY